MTRSAATAGKAFAALGLALAVAAGGYLLGLAGWRPGSWRTIEVQELAIGGLAAPIELELPVLPPRPLKNLVLLVGDGMGTPQIDAARWAAFGERGRFVFERFPVVGLTTTAAVGAPVTESAAAGTALATGVATRKGAVGVGADGRALRTILEAARDAGFATGLVTTSEIHDATPAAFGAHVAGRDQKDEIARQLARSGVDLLIGGGADRFAAVGRDRSDLFSEARARGVVLPSGLDELRKAEKLPLWFLLEGRLDPWRGAPPLAALAERALELLASAATLRSSGFFVLIEEEGIDSAAHGRRSETMVDAFVRFDAAVAAAARFAILDGQTLLLVVGDHGTGGLTIDHGSTAGRLRVTWASGKHTGEAVPIYAYGPAGTAELFTGSYPQHEVARRAAQLLGLDLSANWKGTS